MFAPTPAPSLPLGLLDFLSFGGAESLFVKRHGAVQSARVAEAAGFRRFWVTEHHARAMPSTNPLVLLPLLGSITERIRIGCAVSLIRYRNPLLVAEDLATASHFCPDRLDVGLGRGDISGPGTEALAAVRLDGAALDDAVATVHDTLIRGNGFIDPAFGAFQSWVHGGSANSARTAAATGANYCHALFFNPDPDACRAAMAAHAADHPDGIRAVAVALVSNPDEARAAADADVRGVRIAVHGHPERCAERLAELLADDQIDEVVITEQSARVSDHHRALGQVAEALALALPVPAPAGRR